MDDDGYGEDGEEGEDQDGEEDRACEEHKSLVDDEEGGTSR